MKSYKCENCGASVNPNTGVCEYCGSRYRIHDDNLIRIETYQNPIKTYMAEMLVPDEYVIIDADGISEYAVDSLAHKLADAFKENMDVKLEHDPRMNVQRMTARVRIVEPKYLF